jgi:hypothetical protein
MVRVSEMVPSEKIKIFLLFENLFGSSNSECVTDLDYRGEMIIFKSDLTTFKLSVIFLGSWDSSENWPKPEIKPTSENLACPNH